MEIDRPDADITISGGQAYDNSFHLRNGRMSIVNGGALNSRSSYHYIGQRTSAQAELVVTGANSAWNVQGEAWVGNGATGKIRLTDGGLLKFVDDNTLVLGYTSTWQDPSHGVLVIGSDTNATLAAPGRVFTPLVEMGRGDNGERNATGLVVFNHTDNSGTYTFAPAVIGTGDIRHYAGATTLTGALAYAGDFDIAGGTVTFRGNGANTYTGTTAVGAGAVLNLDKDDDTTAISGPVLIDGGSVNANARNQFDRAAIITLASGGMFTVQNRQHIAGLEGTDTTARAVLNEQLYLWDGSHSYAGRLEGAGRLFLRGGAHTFLGDAGTWAGQIEVGNALLGLGHERAIGERSLFIIGNATLQLAADGMTINNRITGVGIGPALTFDSNGYDGVWSGVISNGTAEPGIRGLGLTKSGTGTLTVTNNNTYEGATTVAAGSLIVNGSIARSSLLTVNSGATLGGSGTVGTTIVSDGGILAPGNSIGTLTVNGNLTLSAGSILDYEMGQAGSDPLSGVSDRINVTGDLDLNGTLNLAQSSDPTDGTAGFGYYRLMTYGGALSGNGLSIGSTPALADPSSYEIQAGGGNVDLFIAAAGDDALQHWQGGDGIWNGTTTKWLNQGGEVPVAWIGNHAVFKNQPGGFDGGTVTVEGTQSFKGLQFVDNGYRLEGGGALATVTGSSEIRVLADSAEIATEITGSGGIIKTQDGTLILSGQNTYQGGTHLLGGVVSVSSDANLGAAAGALTFDGGILRVTDDSYAGTGRAVHIDASGGGFDLGASNSFTVTTDISGTGNLVKQGDGTLVLTGTNSYGNTLIAAGTIVGNAGAISGDIGNAGTAVFDQATHGSFAGDIGGFNGTGGQMIKRGGAELTLLGISALDWTVDAGSLVSAAERFTGDVNIASGAKFAFDQFVDATYEGELRGTGEFIKAGNGTLVYNGDSSSFAGTTGVNMGKLIVGSDAAHSGAVLGGSVNVMYGGTLGGSGTVGSGLGSTVTIADGGTLSPGNSIGTLTVDGDLVFDPGSHFVVEVNPDGADSDLVTVTGDAALNGGAVAHIGANGNYALRSTYTVLSAGGTLSGTFAGVTSDFAFLTPELTYDYAASTVDLKLARNDVDFASVGQTRNQFATAGGIDSIGLAAGHAVYDAIAQLPDDGDLVRGAFDQLSGEIHASAKSALIEDSRFVRSAVNDRLRAAFDGVGASGSAVTYESAVPQPVAANTDRFAVWGQGFGSWGHTSGDGNAARLNRKTGGFFLGADAPMFDTWRFGAVAGYSSTSFDARDRHSSGSSDNYHLGLYGGTAWGDLAFRSGAAYTWHDISTSRNVSFPGFSDSLKGDYNAGTTQVFGELAYGVSMGAARFEPFANLAYVNLHTDGFTEKGGAAALTSRSASAYTTFTTLGLRASTTVDMGGSTLTARGMVGWRHVFDDVTPTSAMRFAGGGNAFTIAGVPVARNAAVVEAGLDFALTPNTVLGVTYGGQFGSGVVDQSFKADFSAKF